MVNKKISFSVSLLVFTFLFFNLVSIVSASWTVNEATCGDGVITSSINEICDPGLPDIENGNPWPKFIEKGCNKPGSVDQCQCIAHSAFVNYGNGNYQCQCQGDYFLNEKGECACQGDYVPVEEEGSNSCRCRFGGSGCPAGAQNCVRGTINEDRSSWHCSVSCPANSHNVESYCQCDDGYYSDEGICKPFSVSVYLDPAYVAVTDQTRHFKPSDITPFDDIICELKAGGISNVRAKLITYDVNKNEVDIPLQSSSLVQTGNSYQLKIKGWSNNMQGWTTDNTIMDKLVASRKVNCTFEYTENGKKMFTGPRENTKVESCVHLWGKDDAKFKIVSFRTEGSDYSSAKLVGRSQEIKQVFNQIDPFKTYNFLFNQQIELKTQLNKDSLATSCQRDFNIIFDAIPNYRSYASNDYVVLESRIIPARGKGLFYSPGGEEDYMRVFGHEFGHYFCGLQDEYKDFISVPGSIIDNLPGFKSVNCFTAKSFIEVLPYGSPVFECFYSYNYLRTSSKSIMSGRDSFKFNSWSCGVCLEKLDLKGSSKQNAAFCSSKLDVISEFTDPSDYHLQCSFDSDCDVGFGFDVGCGRCSRSNSPTSAVCTPNIDAGAPIVCRKDGAVGQCNSNGKCVVDNSLECTSFSDCSLKYGYDSGCGYCYVGKCGEAFENTPCTLRETSSSGGVAIFPGKCMSGKCVKIN